MSAVQEMFPKAEVEHNKEKPRRRSFNVSVNGKKVWNGLKLGPPRKLKFDILAGQALHDKIMEAC